MKNTKGLFATLSHTERADFLLYLAREQFLNDSVYMGEWVVDNTCGTTACISGHALVHLIGLRPKDAFKHLSLPEQSSPRTLANRNAYFWRTIAKQLYGAASGAPDGDQGGPPLYAFEAAWHTLSHSCDEDEDIDILVNEIELYPKEAILRLGKIWLQHAEDKAFYSEILKTAKDILEGRQT